MLAETNFLQKISNIIFGKNDCGKSNIIRALNLFFNDETEFNSNYNHEIDYNSGAQALAKTQRVRQQATVKITFIVPQSHKKSLGTEFALSRSWGLDEYFSETISNIKGKSTKIAPQNLTKFLNKIDFTAITPVKQDDIYHSLFRKYLNIIGARSALDSEMEQLTEKVTEVTDTFTKSLSTRLKNTIKVRTAVGHEALLGNFDIGVGDDNHSMFKQKGDGVKVSYLVELLSAMAKWQKDTKFSIWAIEEPENSLDLERAQTEAKNIATASKLTQVFVTTHSPVFYALDENPTFSRIAVTSNEELERTVSKIVILDTPSKADSIMAEAGLSALPLLGRELRAIQVENYNYIRQNETLKNELNKITLPTLLVEGKWDKSLIETAFRLIGVSENSIVVKELGGVNGQDLRQAVSPHQPTFAFFDYDPEGRKVYLKSGGNKPHDFEIESPQNNFYVCLLKPTEDFELFANAHITDKNKRIFTMEYMFPSSQLIQISNDAIKKYSGSDKDKILSELDYLHEVYNRLDQVVSNPLRKLTPTDDFYIYTRKIHDCIKTKIWPLLLENPIPEPALVLARKICDKLNVSYNSA